MNTLDSHQKVKKIRNYLLWYVFILVVLGSFTIGLFLGRTQNVLHNYANENSDANKTVENKYTTKSEGADFDLFWQAWDTVEKKFVNQPLDYQKMVYGAISGMLGALDDPYTAFMTPEEDKEFQQEITGSFEGIGAEVGMKNDRIVIISPLEGSPAEKAGLRPHDIILKINDEKTDEMNLFGAVSKIRGQAGTEVVLSIQRNGAKEPKEFKIIREKITQKSVTWKEEKLSNGKKVAHLEISYFGEDTARNLQSAATEILKKKEGGIILDLRNNGGGYLESSIDVLSVFVEPNTVVAFQESGDKSRKEFHSRGNTLLKDLPLVILVNGGSASASEIVAGGLHDIRKSSLIGEKTFGKGSVQEYIPLPNNSSMRVSIAKWLTANGKNINGEGIPPDIEMKMTNDDYEKDRDPQLDRAKEEIAKLLK